MANDEEALRKERPDASAIDSNKPTFVQSGKTHAKERISHFTWPWFACTMATGAVAVVLGKAPYRFTGLGTIGKIFFILDLILLIFFSILLSIRFCMRPTVAIRSLHHPPEGLFFGAFWVSIALVLNCAEIYGSTPSGGWLTRALEVCFWLYSACAFCVGVFQYTTLFVAERLPVSAAMPAWIFPAYPLLVIGSLAGTLLKSQPPDAALPMFIGSIMLQGLGWTISVCMYAIYIQRLMSSPLPPPPSRPGMYVSVGPTGYTSAALLSLGMRAPSVIPADFLSISSVSVGDIFKIVGVASGIFLFLLSFWFFCLSTVSVLEGVREMSFTLNWWAFIFPNGGMVLALTEIGKILHSRPIKIITSVMIVALVMMWFVVAAAHVYAVWKNQILWEGKDEDHGMDSESRSVRERRKMEEGRQT